MVKIDRKELPTPRYEYGGDDYVFVELDQDMSFDANFKAQAITRALRSRDLPGIIEIAPANTSYLVQFDPGDIHPDELIRELKELEHQTDILAEEWEATVYDIPVLYQDEWTHETVMNFRDRHQDPASTDLEYCARINGFDSVADFIDHHSGPPHLVSLVGFVPGLPQCFQMCPREEQIVVPKYEQPRTNTPGRAVGQGGAFTCIYPAQGAGGYQLYGRTPIEVLDTTQTLPDFRDSISLPNPGDIISYRQISREEYDAVREEITDGSYRFNSGTVTFHPDEFFRDPYAYNEEVMGVLA